MKTILLFSCMLLFCGLAQAQVQSAGSSVTSSIENSASLTTSITVPSSAFSSNLIAVAVTEYQNTFPVTITDKESGKHFTLAVSTTTRNGNLLAIYYLVNAATGLHTIQISTGSGNNTNMKTVTSAYTGVDYASPIAYSNSNFNTAVNNTPFINISCATDQVVVNALTYEAMVTEGASSNVASQAAINKMGWNLESASKTSTSGNLNINWDYASAARGFWASLAITLQPTSYAIIPGQLFNFTGKLVNNKIELSWITTFETNVKYISVMRSTDNKDWKEITRLAGAGNSTGQKQYSAEDKNVEGGNYFYKLVFISGDGKKSSSFIVNVKSGSDKKLRFGNMQNPFTTSLQVNVFSPSDKKIHFTILNSRGIAIASGDANPQNGSATYSMEHAAHLAPGIYFLHCVSENEMISKTIVKN